MLELVTVCLSIDAMRGFRLQGLPPTLDCILHNPATNDDVRAVEKSTFLSPVKHTA